MRRSFPLDAVVRVFVASVMFASFIFYVDHFQELMFTAMRWLFPLDAENWLFVAIVMSTSFVHDIDKSMRFAVFCAMRRFSTLTAIIRALLLRTTFLAIYRHIVPKYANNMQ